LARPCFGWKIRSVASLLAWPGHVLVGKNVASRFAWLNRTVTSRKIWGTKRPWICGFFCQIDVGWAGDVVGEEWIYYQLI
jgi:hypothetical protein